MSWAAAIVLALVAFALGSFAFARILGASVKTVALGFPRIFKFRTGDTEWELGLIPLNAYTLPRGRADDYDGPGSWKRLDLGRRILILTAPWMLVAIVAVGLRGWGSIANGFSEILLRLDTAPLWRALFSLHVGFAAVVGIVFAKNLTANLPPLFFALVGEVRKKPSVIEPIFMVLLFLWIAARFGWGLYRALVT